MSSPDANKVEAAGAGIRARLLEGPVNAEVYRILLNRMNSLPDVIGFTTGMGERMGLEAIAKDVKAAKLTANCELGHVLYAYAMGWSEAPLPGNGHGAFTRPKAIRVLQRFPEWPAGWEAQLSRVAQSLRPARRHAESEEPLEWTAFQWLSFIVIVVSMIAWFTLEDLCSSFLERFRRFSGDRY